MGPIREGAYLRGGGEGLKRENTVSANTKGAGQGDRVEPTSLKCCL